MHRPSPETGTPTMQVSVAAAVWVDVSGSIILQVMANGS
jgi:hypothetical protein